MNYLGLHKLKQLTHSAKKLNHLLTPLVLTAMASLALLCSSFYKSVLPLPSSVTASILSPFWTLSTYDFLVFFLPNLIFLFLIFLFLPSFKLLLSLTALNFIWLGVKKESNTCTVSHKFTGTQRRHSNTVPLSCCLHPSCWVPHSFFGNMKSSHRSNLKAAREKEINF